MRAIGFLRHLAFVLIGFSLLLALPAQAGLYGDEGKEVKSGDLNATRITGGPPST